MPTSRRPPRRAAIALVAVAAGCFDSGTRWREVPGDAPPAPLCPVGLRRCAVGLEECQQTPQGAAWTQIEDCEQQGLICAPTLLQCAVCVPGARTCAGQDIRQCNDLGTVVTVVETCDPAKDLVCRLGECVNLCVIAAQQRSNVGCEYWGVDLDNFSSTTLGDAAAQQYAIVVSNPQPDVAVTVRIEQDDSLPGEPGAPQEVASAVIQPHNLRVFKLGPREIDGSPEGEFNTGPGSAHTRRAYRVRASAPVVAYQFNPLENLNVFSNDASLLKPTEALSYGSSLLQTAYVVAGWPQTIAITSDPQTNFGGYSAPAFLTLVGTRPGTKVRITTTARVVAGLGVPEVPVGGTLETTLDPHDVLNLETADFRADFTGTLVEATGPVVAFTGVECADAPHFEKLSDRRCCCDHLEDQLDPTRTAGKTFVLAHAPSRTKTIVEAGAQIAMVPEPEYYRFVATTNQITTVKTTLPPPNHEFALSGLGAWREVTALRDFMATSDRPLILSNVQASQQAAGIKTGLPGGDPSLLIVPPVEQYRPDYVFLTPDKYAFDFIVVIATPDTKVLLDGQELDASLCEIAPGDGLTPDERGSDSPPYLVYRCQLSFATIDPNKNPPDNVLPGKQNDGVHRIVADAPVGVLVWGFDSYVSYSYAAGTELREIAPPN